MMEKQELLQQLNERFQYLNQQIKVLEHQLSELKEVKSAVESVSNGEMFFPLGAGVFIKGKVIPGNFLMNVGKGIVVEKNSKDVLSIVDHQISSLENIFVQMNTEMKEIISQIQMTQLELQKA